MIWFYVSTKPKVFKLWAQLANILFILSQYSNSLNYAVV